MGRQETREGCMPIAKPMPTPRNTPTPETGSEATQHSDTQIVEHTELRLAANEVKWPNLSNGHLQLVLVKGEIQDEIEVLAPDSKTFGKWQYPDIRDHTNTEHTRHFSDPEKYAFRAFSDSELGGRNPDDVWKILADLHLEFTEKGKNISYDLNQNSNSYINTALSVVGLDVDDYVADAMPPGIARFWGLPRNVLESRDPGAKLHLNLEGTVGDDIINTGLGNDTLQGVTGDDSLSGGGGNDILSGGNGSDTLEGGVGGDTLNGDGGDDSLSGEGGNDELAGGEGSDILDGDIGNDDLNGGEGADSLSGGNGNDDLTAGEGSDTLYGGLGDDNLSGGEGDDYLFGGYDRSVYDQGVLTEEQVRGILEPYRNGFLTYAEGSSDDLTQDGYTAEEWDEFVVRTVYTATNPGWAAGLGVSPTKPPIGLFNDWYKEKHGDVELYHPGGDQDYRNVIGDHLLGGTGQTAHIGLQAVYGNGELITHGPGAGTIDLQAPGYLGPNYNQPGNTDHLGWDIIPFEELGWELYHQLGWSPVSQWPKDEAPEYWGRDGADDLMGGAGNDTYGFILGGQHDIITDDGRINDDQDVLEIYGGGWLDNILEDLEFSLAGDGSDLAMTVRGTTDQVTILDMNDPSKQVEHLHLWNADQSQLNVASLPGIYTGLLRDALLGRTDWPFIGVDNKGVIGLFDPAGGGQKQVIGKAGVTLFDIDSRYDGKLFGVTANAFYSIDGTTGAATFISRLPSTSANSLEIAADGTAYVADPSGNLLSINTFTGDSTHLGPIASGSAHAPFSSNNFGASGDLQFVEGNLFMTSTARELVNVNLTEPTASSSVGPFEISEDLYGLALSEHHGLMGFGSKGGVYDIDVNTGKAQLITKYATTFNGAGTYIVPEPNTPPDIVATNQELKLGTFENVSSWFSATDADGDTIDWWAVYDYDRASTSGSFRGSGVAPNDSAIEDGTFPAEKVIRLTSEQLASLEFGGSDERGTEALAVTAWDGTEWGDWAIFGVTVGLPDLANTSWDVAGLDVRGNDFSDSKLYFTEQDQQYGDGVLKGFFDWDEVTNSISGREHFVGDLHGSKLTLHGTALEDATNLVLGDYRHPDRRRVRDRQRPLERFRRHTGRLVGGDRRRRISVLQRVRSGEYV
ncbi:MAG: hypothetical protein IPM60_17790 [Rhodospirillales bacterium]|nr:hypothetical protein [Rhodospirillales bacterium]